MSTSDIYVHEVLEAGFDGAGADEHWLKLARLVDDHPEIIENLVVEVFIHSLLQWDGERASPDMTALDPIVAYEINDPDVSPC